VVRTAAKRALADVGHTIHVESGRSLDCTTTAYRSPRCS
jgi:hypothetical protein